MAKYILFFEGNEKELGEALKVKGLQNMGALTLDKDVKNRPIFQFVSAKAAQFTHTLTEVDTSRPGHTVTQPVPVKFEITPNSGVFFWVNRIDDTPKTETTDAELLALAKVR